MHRYLYVEKQKLYTKCFEMDINIINIGPVNALESAV